MAVLLGIETAPPSGGAWGGWPASGAAVGLFWFCLWARPGAAVFLGWLGGWAMELTCATPPGLQVLSWGSLALAAVSARAWIRRDLFAAALLFVNLFSMALAVFQGAWVWLAGEVPAGIVGVLALRSMLGTLAASVPLVALLQWGMPRWLSREEPFAA